MKQKISKSAPVTEEKLREVLADFLKNHPTKIQMELFIEEKFREYDEKAKEYRDQILNGQDQLMGELSQNREDNLFRDHDIKNLKEDTEDLKKRVTKLEEPN